MNLESTTVKPRILAIDDNEFNLKLMACMLEFTECKLYLESQSSNGLNAALAFHPHIIFLDIFMPNPDGFEVYRQIKGNTKTQKIPIIFNSTNDDSDTIEMVQNLNAEGFIRKPFNVNEVTAAINLYRPRNSDEVAAELASPASFFPN